MTEKKMLIVPAELVRQIDDNRGDLSQAEFVGFLIQNALEEKGRDAGYATREELKALEETLTKASQANSKKFATQEDMATFERDIKKLFKNFVDFFVGYGLELGKKTPLSELEELTSKLEDFESDLPPGGGKDVKIKYK